MKDQLFFWKHVPGYQSPWIVRSAVLVIFFMISACTDEHTADPVPKSTLR